MSSLTSNGQALPMAGATVAAQINESLDIHASFTSQISFYSESPVDDFTNLSDFGLGQRIGLLIQLYVCLSEEPPRHWAPNPKNIGERYFHPFIAREIDSRDTSH